MVESRDLPIDDDMVGGLTYNGSSSPSRNELYYIGGWQRETLGRHQKQQRTSLKNSTVNDIIAENANNFIQLY